jgi:hypothetical protein
MADLALVYGMRLLPAEELGSVEEATFHFKDGREGRISMHLIQGTKEQIEKQFRASVEAFFDLYPEI